MFRQLAAVSSINAVLAEDARVLSHLLEVYWDARIRGVAVSTLNFAPATIGVNFPNLSAGVGTYLQRHLVYAYCVEACGAWDVMAAVVRQFATSERLGIAQQAATYQWLATTEELFFRDGGPFTPFPTTSRLRPDVNANRRQTYYRMFGMDLPARDGATTIAYDKPMAANRDFVATLETLLRETWRAIENATNAVGPNPVDRQAILDLAQRLQDMLIARRGGTRTNPFGPNLAREEFLYTAAMSWMHLTVEADTPVVQDLRATAPSPDERLRIIGERVGTATHRHTRSFLLLADALAILLTNIEAGTHSNQVGADALWQAGPASDLMRLIINHWSITTGRDIKGQSQYALPRGPVTSAVAAPGPIAPAGTAGTAATATAGNGSRLTPAGVDGS